MIAKLEKYLGHSASIMLDAVPFKHWVVQKSFDDDLDVPLTHYVFPENGLELRCDRDDRISAIFLFSDEFGGFDENLLEIPFSWSRRQVLEYCGDPSKSGSATKHPILGEYGAWDRFVMPKYAVRFEYRTDADTIKNITLMQADVIPS